MHSELKLTSIGISYLDQARKWTFFLSIIGFIATAFIVIMALFFGSIMASLNEFSGGMTGAVSSGMITVIYLIIGIIYFFISLYLYRFSVRTKAAIHEQDSAQLEDGLKNLKSYWKLTGIITPVGIAVYAVAIVLMLVGGMAMFAMS
jgi:hypothetical protein